MVLVTNRIFLPKGFTYRSTHCRITSVPDKEDLGLIYSHAPCNAWGLFTQSSLKSPSVLISRKNLLRSRPRAILANSGCANCATGKQGFLHVDMMAEQIASGLGIESEQVLIAQTGIIGEELPYAKVKMGISTLLKGKETSLDSLLGFARSIMTTDTVPKIASRCFTFPSSDEKVNILGIAKGSGMIQPNLATMLAFILSDVSISVPMIKESLKSATKSSLNALVIDGQTSPNDMVLMLANGYAKNRMINKRGEDFRKVSTNLSDVLLELTRKIVSDGEGATKVVEVEVCGAQSHTEAERAARAIANSPLVKTAFFGCDPNWGRVLSALGTEEIKFHIDKVGIDLMPVQKARNNRVIKLVSKGRKARYDQKRARDIMRSNFRLRVNLNKGRQSATIFTCDLTYDYIKINAEYHS